MPPINNQKGLDALKALASGGSQGLNAYQQAQSQEAAARTSALQGALGDNDVAAAAQKAQAQFAPKVASGDLGIGNLDVAANNYLSRASNKLAAKQYEDQQRLALQTEALERQKTEISPQERMLQLQGAAEVMAQKQRDDLAQNMTLDQSLNTLAARKADLRNRLTEFDRAPGILEGAQFTAEHLAQRDAQRQSILDQMGALDQQYAAASQQYAGLLGTNNKGFMEAYAKADQGDVEAIRGLNQFLAPTREAAMEQRSNAIDVGGQERLRALAPAFGIDPLTAAGQFREGEGDDMSRLNAMAAQQEFITGGTKRDQAAADEQNAQTLGFSSGKDLNEFKKSADMSDDDIQGTLGSSEWQALGGLTDAFVTGQEVYELPGGQKLPLGTGKEGFIEAIRTLVNNEQNPLTHEDGKAYTQAEKSRLVQLATKYYGRKVFELEGKGEAAEVAQ